ncbi:fructose-bisphosphatase class III [bacterium]|nr:fructose-bisphosphatase class III [bacterium]
MTNSSNEDDVTATRGAIGDAVLGSGAQSLPPRPEHFVSDIHGEAAAFTHLVRTRSGEVRAVVERVLAGAGSPEAIDKLVTLTYYPEHVVDRAHAKQLDTRSWWTDKLGSLCMLVSIMGREFPGLEMTGCRVGEASPAVACGATAVAEPGVTSDPDDVRALRALVAWGSAPRGAGAFDAAVDALVASGAARTAICTIASWIRRTCAGTTHMLGDIWDRGARGDAVMAQLMAIPECDVQWGNHDVCWMGAAGGDPTCVATCLRNNLKYGNVEQFERGYGIGLDDLRAFAARTYVDEGEGGMPPVLKAISVLLFKSEGQAIRRHPEWHMGRRLLLDKMDLAAGIVRVGDADYPLRTTDFPTVDLAPGGDAYAYTAEEARVMDGLVAAFTGSERLRAQIQWLYDNGGVYRVVPGRAGRGGYLLVHGCVPLAEDGTLAQVDCGDRTRAGRELLDWTDAVCRRAWEGRAQADLDWMGFFWTGWQSTFMGRVVKTFERTYLTDTATWAEPEDPYYALTNDDPAACGVVLRAFGCDPERDVIVNGHTPVKLPKGQRPVRGGGRRYVIDGGFCRAYRKSTGIAGYTLIDDDEGVRLVTHGEFAGLDAALDDHADVSHESERLA